MTKEYELLFGGDAPLAKLTIAQTQEIAELRRTCKVAVNPMSTPGQGFGFYAHRVRNNGSVGLAITGACATESGAWVLAAFRLARIKLGGLILTSREFGSRWQANTLRLDGSLGVLEWRSRLEIRWLGSAYIVVSVDRRYLEGEVPRDVEQRVVATELSTVSSAAEFVVRYIADFEGAAADDRDAALESQSS
ncbi:hypothetical protein ACOTCG_09870 [Achromobacter xylosoxidans]